jgi:hypothetical protein
MLLCLSQVDEMGTEQAQNNPHLLIVLQSCTVPCQDGHQETLICSESIEGLNLLPDQVNTAVNKDAFTVGAQSIASKLSKLSGEYLCPQRTLKTADFFIRKILGWRVNYNFEKCKNTFA